MVSCIEKGSDTDLQLSERQFAKWRTTTEEQQPVRYVGIRKNGAQATSEAVACHGVTQGAADRKADLRRRDSGVVNE